MQARTRLRRKLLVVLLAPVLGCLAAEFGLRWLLFGEDELATRWGATCRSPVSFADPASEDYWLLSQLWLKHPGPLPHEVRDPELGWLAEEFRREGWAHIDEANVGSRRPVLLFGDSYARGMVPYDRRFQALLDQTELGSTHALLNYAVGAFGLDQVLLLAREVVPRWRERDPIVLVGLCLDDSVDRALLDFRGWPKPRFLDDADELVLAKSPVPTLEEYMASHEPGITSYAWAALEHSGMVPETWSPDRPEFDDEWVASARRMTQRVLATLHAELEAARVPHAFLLFEGPHSMWRNGPLPFRVEAAIETLDAIGARYALIQPLLAEHALRTGANRASYFGDRGQERDHLTAEGHRAALPALVAAIRDEHLTSARRGPLDARDFVVGGDTLPAIPTAAWTSFAEGPDRLILWPREQRVTRLVYRPEGRARGFTAEVQAESRTSAPTGHLVVHVDDRPPRVLAIGAAPTVVEIDLVGAHALQLSARPENATDDTWFVFACPRFD